MITPERTLKSTSALAGGTPAAKPLDRAGDARSKPGLPRQSQPAAGTRSTEHAVRAPPPQLPVTDYHPLDTFFDRLIRFFSSLRLTVVCLALGIVLVFAGTLAQVDLGLLQAQNQFFRSLLIYWTPKGASFKVPVFPGGYLLGGVLLINLVTAHVTRFKWTRKKAGIWVIHFGIIVLLVGQLLTDMLARESALALFEGENKNYSEDFRATELVLIDKSDSQSDLVYSVPQKLFSRQTEVRDARLPVTLRVKKWWANAAVVAPDSKAPMAILSGATAGGHKEARLIPLAPVSETDKRDAPAALIEVVDGKQSLGSFFLTTLAGRGEEVSVGGKQYEVALRFIRYYHPFSLTLLKATHEQYRGTGIPKNFASRVRVQNPDQNEARETTISMNKPLRYGGLTFFQYQMAAGEMVEEAGATPSSTFQVVRNPSWLSPYIACVLIALGLLVQFGSHLFGFVKRKTI